MLEKISKQIVEMIITECKKDTNKKVIKNSIIDPLVMNILVELQPFIIAGIIYFISTFLMIVILIVILVYPISTSD